MYEFRKIGHTQSAQQCEFENIFFKKSQPELLHYIKRKATTIPTAPTEGGSVVSRRQRRVSFTNYPRRKCVALGYVLFIIE